LRQGDRRGLADCAGGLEVGEGLLDGAGEGDRGAGELGEVGGELVACAGGDDEAEDGADELGRVAGEAADRAVVGEDGEGVRVVEGAKGASAGDAVEPRVGHEGRRARASSISESAWESPLARAAAAPSVSQVRASAWRASS